MTAITDYRITEVCSVTLVLVIQIQQFYDFLKA